MARLSSRRSKRRRGIWRLLGVLMLLRRGPAGLARYALLRPIVRIIRRLAR
jgi:hypothetical protein